MRPQQFSRRTAWDMTETAWAKLLRERRLAGLPVLDLTASNPTQCGFDYDKEVILAALQNPAVLRYEPIPKGLPVAREAVARYYADHHAPIDPDHIFLTTSTSEAYSFLFRLLCDPGDEVLVAQPSYPLFDFLAGLDDVRLVSYPLFYDYGWHLDPEALRRRITPLTKAIVLVHPNNPTGHFTKAAERRILEGICQEHGLSLIVDEVFLDYSLADTSFEPTFALGDHPVPTFILSGISKISALPQMKASWIACFGQGPDCFQALERLEVIADTFLSINAPVQWAMPQFLGGRAKIQEHVKRRIAGNLNALDEVIGRQGLVSRLIVDAGWYTVLRVPASTSGEDAALDLLSRHGIAIHSGDSFGFSSSGWLIASLLAPPPDFRDAICRITDFVESRNNI